MQEAIITANDIINQKTFIFKTGYLLNLLNYHFQGAIGSYKRQAKFMILEKGTITFKNGYAYGTPLNDSTAAFSERLRSMKNKYPNPEDMELLRQSVEDEFFAFVARHKNDPCAVYAILLAHKRLENDKLLKLIQSTSPEIQLDGDVHAIKASLTKGK